MKKYLNVILFFSLCAFREINQSITKTVEIMLPKKETVELQPYTTIDHPQIYEASGLVKSRMWPNVIWTHNNSGDEPRIFPIRKDGSVIKPTWMEDYIGIQIPDAVNVDWESITTDDEGHLYIGDIGNNNNTRRDLCIYVIDEPYPNETVMTCVSKRISFFYSDQKTIPPEKNNFDAEAMFWRNGELYILTKHRSDTYTKLYRLNSMDPLDKNSAVPIIRINIHGQVSGADISPDGKRLIILTYNAIWLFEVNRDGDDLFDGNIFWLPIKAGHVEAVCLDGDEIIIASEVGKLYKLKIKDLIVVRK